MPEGLMLWARGTSIEYRYHFWDTASTIPTHHVTNDVIKVDDITPQLLALL